MTLVALTSWLLTSWTLVAADEVQLDWWHVETRAGCEAMARRMLEDRAGLPALLAVGCASDDGAEVWTEMRGQPAGRIGGGP